MNELGVAPAAAADDAEHGGDRNEGREALRESAIGTGPVCTHDRVDRRQHEPATGHHREEDEVGVEGEPSRLRIRCDATDEGDDADHDGGKTDVEERLGQYARVRSFRSRNNSAHD